MEEVKNTQIKIFEEKQVRTLWDKETEEWYFSVVDVIAVLTDSPNPRNYWKVLKHRLNGEGSELVTNCNQLKMLSSDGKMYKTDCMTTEQLFRLCIFCNTFLIAPQLCSNFQIRLTNQIKTIISPKK